MRKLFLASFQATTGEVPFGEQRIIAVECDTWESEESQIQKGSQLFKEWFAENYVESTLITLVIHPTISGAITYDSAMRNRVVLDRGIDTASTG